MSYQERAWRAALASACVAGASVVAPAVADEPRASGGLTTGVGKQSANGHSGAASDGVSLTDNVVMTADGDAWTVLDVIEVTTPPRQKRYCVAVASIDVVNPGICGDPIPAGLLYVFTLTLDNINPAADGGAERTVEFVNTNCPIGGDARLKEVTTTSFFEVRPGNHFIYLLGRPEGEVSAAINDASTSVICTERRLP
jgi:uncharacterized membrane protein